MFFQITKAATPLTGCRRQLILRSLSSSTNNTQIEVDNKTGFATLSMNRPPVNLLNLELINSLTRSMKEMEQNKCRGKILTSVSLVYEV